MLISLCVIALNEEKTIEHLLNDIKKQSFPHSSIQLILVDSCSQDDTKKIMNEFFENSDFFDIKVLDNIKKKQAAGWNVAIQNAIGDVIIRVDAHASIPTDFIEKNIKVLESGEDISGGKRPNILVNSTNWTELLLTAESSMFGSSIAPYRKSEEKKYVNSMFHAAYRKEVFNNVGLFNEKLGRTEDNELHYRMRKAGYKFCYSPEIVSYQHVRSSLKKMLKQKFLNGYWIGLTLGVCPRCLSLYHFVPASFVLALIVCSIISLYTPFFILLLLALYFSFAILMSFFSLKQTKKISLVLILLPFIFFSLHFFYGIGTIIGILAYPFKRKSLSLN